MKTAIKEDSSAFIIEAMQCFNASLEIPVVVGKMYEFLEKYFPLEGISLHKVIPEKHGVEAFFFMTNEGLKKQAEFTYMEADEIGGFRVYENDPRPILFKFEEVQAQKLVKKLFLIHLENQRPDILVIHLQTKELIGHFALFSKKGEEFNQEHIDLLALLAGVLTSAMINIYHYTELKKSKALLQEENTNLRMHSFEKQDIIANSTNMQKALQMVHVLARKDVQILILGETGTGKEVIANIIQENSARKEKIFLKVNCGAIPESLIDSELFGYEKGAFTGAFSTKKGYFEQADGGTLFLDEIGELSMQAQVRLLRVLQFGLIERVGGKQSIPVDVRIIAATNRNLENMLHLGTFREDLYYRLHAFPIKIPPLRKRREDIPLLLNHFIKKFARNNMISEPEIDHKSLQNLLNYSWPGNVRELENNVERCIVLSSDNVIDFAEYLPKNPNWYLENDESLDEYEYKAENKGNKISDNDDFIQQVAKEVAKILAKENKVPAEIKEIKSLDELKKEQILEALVQSNGRICGKNSAAEILNLKCGTLRKRMEKLGIKGNKVF